MRVRAINRRLSRGGRPTTEWLAQLLEYGLLRGSLIREFDLTRYRVQQTRERSREVNRLQKVLEDAGVKVTSVLTDGWG